MYKNFRKMLVLYKGSKRPLLISQVFLFLSVAVNQVVMALNARLINDGVEAGNIDVVISTAMWMIGLTLVLTVFSIGNAIYAVMFSEGTANFLRVQTFRKVQTFSFGNLDRFRTGDLLVRLTADVNNVKSAVLFGVMNLLQAPFTILMVLLITLLLAPRQLPLMIGVMVVVSVVLFSLLRNIQKLFVIRQAALDVVNNILQENLSGVRVVKAFVRERYESQRFAQASDNQKDAALAPAYRIAVFLPTATALIYTSVVVIYFVMGREVMLSQTLSLGEVVIFSQLLAAALVPITMLAFILPYLEAGEASLGRIIEVLADTPEVQDKPDAKRVDPASIRGRKVLRHNTFEARPGAKIGLVGPTGAGKSTIMNILTRYYDLDSGAIEIDGANIADYSQESLRRSIGQVLQEAFLFSDTVMANLRYAREGATDEECIAAAKQANAHDFIMQLPNGYDTVLTERGANLSQGQRQMITIARAMVANPKMLVLDEATSNVDTRTEKLIQEGLKKLMEGKTSFVVAHRLSTIQDSDQILVINKGEIVERGTHEDLLAQRGFYFDLYMSQFKGKLAQFAAA